MNIGHKRFDFTYVLALGTKTFELSIRTHTTIHFGVSFRLSANGASMNILRASFSEAYNTKWKKNPGQVEISLHLGSRRMFDKRHQFGKQEYL